MVSHGSLYLCEAAVDRLDAHFLSLKKTNKLQNQTKSKKKKKPSILLWGFDIQLSYFFMSVEFGFLFYYFLFKKLSYFRGFSIFLFKLNFSLL